MVVMPDRGIGVLARIPPLPPFVTPEELLEDALPLLLQLFVKILVGLALVGLRRIRLIHERQVPFQDERTLPESRIVGLRLWQFVRGHDRQVRLLPRGFLLRVGLACSVTSE